MANVLTEFPIGGRGKAGSSIYDKYLDGQVWEIVPGADIPAKNARSIQAYFSSIAKKRNIRIRTAARNGNVIVQVVTNGD